MAVQLGGCIYTNTPWKEPELIILQALFFPGVFPSFNEVIPTSFHHAAVFHFGPTLFINTHLVLSHLNFEMSRSSKIFFQMQRK